MTTPVAILAGGLATRLGPIAQSVPKALLDVAGKPFAVRQIELLRRNGLSTIVFCLGHLAQQVQDTLGDGSRWSVRILYSLDGPRPLGTGGALKKARPLLGDNAFMVFYGDSYLPCDYQQILQSFRASGKEGLMTVFRNDGLWDTSNVEFRDGEIKAYDIIARTPAMRHIDYGMGLLKTSVLDAYPANEPLDLAVVYQDLLKRKQLSAAEASQRFFEIGSPAGYQETCQYFQTEESQK